MKYRSIHIVSLFVGFSACSIMAQTGGGTAGLYATTDNNYRIEVKFAPGKLVVVEPNKTSEYIQRPNTGIYDFKNPTNGISYILEVAGGGKALKAYKPDTPDNVTDLALVRAASPIAQGPAPGVLRIPVQNKEALNPDLEELWGVREIEGVNLEGLYTPDGEPHPFLELKPKGEGTMEMHGAPNPEHVYPIKWWIQANSDGTLVKTDHPAAVQYMLIVQYGRPYQGDEFDRMSLNVSKVDG
jgi:hypothetical protein